MKDKTAHSKDLVPLQEELQAALLPKKDEAKARIFANLLIDKILEDIQKGTLQSAKKQTNLK